MGEKKLAQCLGYFGKDQGRKKASSNKKHADDIYSPGSGDMGGFFFGEHAGVRNGDGASGETVFRGSQRRGIQKVVLGICPGFYPHGTQRISDGLGSGTFIFPGSFDERFLKLMTLLGIILLWSLVGSIFSLVGGILLTFKKSKFSHSQSLVMISFAAGVLLSTAFLDLLPEAAEMGIQWPFVLGGIVFLFVFEKVLNWHHHDIADEQVTQTPALITLGDTVHNLIDGMVIAGAFLVSIPSGIVISLAVAAHEIPHEMADFGVLLSKGWSRTKTIAVNVLSAMVSLVGAVGFYFIGSRAEFILPYLLSFSAGSFIYLACSDLIPELHHCHGDECDIKNSWWQIPLFLLGIFVVWSLITLLEG